MMRVQEEIGGLIRAFLRYVARVRRARRPSATADRERVTLAASGGVDRRGLESRPRTWGLLGFAAAGMLATMVLVAPAPVAGAQRAGTAIVIDREDIALSGAATLSELLSSRSGFNNFGLHGARFGTGVAVYLVNGRPVSGLDLTTLPLAAVERVEIRNEGPVRNSAYGIGAVIDIVLRNDFAGFEVSAGTGLPSRKGMDSRHGSALLGGALGRGHVTAAVSHFRRDELRARDRDLSHARYTPGGSYADAQGVSEFGNTVILPGDDGGRFGLGDCEEPTYTGILSHPAGEICGFPSGDIYWLRGRDAHESLHVAADQPLPGASEVYAQARAAQGERFSVSTPNADRLTISPTGEARQRLLDAVVNLPPGYVFPSDGEVTLLHRFVGHGNREWATDLEQHGLTLGVRGDTKGGLGYDVHVEYDRDREVETGTNLQSLSLVRAAIESGAYDLAQPLSRAPEHLQAIRDTRVGSTRTTQDEYTRAHASLAGELLTVAGGPVRWTAGVEVQEWDHRRVYDLQSQNRAHENDDVIGYGGASLVADRRRVSLMAESTVPVREHWDLTLGARRDDYDDVGEAISLRIANGYQLSDTLALRASWSRAAHPPGLFWVHSPQAQYFATVCDPLLEDDDGNPLCVGNIHLVTAGNPDLGPDRVERVSAGATATFGGFSFSADWFLAHHSDLPGIPSSQVVVDRAAAGNPLPGTSVERRTDGDGSIERISVRSGPFGALKDRGIALHASVDWETDWADLALDVHATRTLHHRHSFLGLTSPGGYVRDRAHAVLKARRGDFAASWSVYGRSGYLNGTETGRYPGWFGHDLTLHWRDAGGIDLTGGILNVANRGASLDSSRDHGPVRSLDSDRGRTFFLTATMRW